MLHTSVSHIYRVWLKTYNEKKQFSCNLYIVLCKPLVKIKIYLQCKVSWNIVENLQALVGVKRLFDYLYTALVCNSF